MNCRSSDLAATGGVFLERSTVYTYTIWMMFDVVPLREEGWALPRFRACMLRPVRGDLLVRDLADHGLHRACRVARLRDPVTLVELPAPRPLYDATLLCVDWDYMTLTGFERVFDELAQREYHYAQSWLLKAVGDSEGAAGTPGSKTQR